MRPRSIAAVAATLIAAASMTPIAASAAGQNTLYVNNQSADCTDSGSGAYTAPYCTIQAAADAANPGDVVNILAGSYGATTVTRSGTASDPIIITTGTGRIAFNAAAGQPALTLNGVNDVEIRDFRVLGESQDSGITVNGGSGVGLVGDSFSWTTPTASLHITGGASGVTVRDTFLSNGIVVDGAATGTVLTTDYVMADNGSPISIADATNTAVTSNTIGDCAPGISVAASTGTAIENNVIEDALTSANQWTCPAAAEGFGIVVDPGSAPATKADYNDVYANNGAAYDWNGKAYSTAADLYAGTGQGEHDYNSQASVLGNEGSPMIDSADSGAIGEQATDIDGDPRIADPLVTPTGVGPSDYYDRGAFEFQDPYTAVTRTFTTSATKVPTGAVFSVHAAMTDTWSDNLVYQFQLSDGTILATDSTGTASASISSPGDWGVELWAKSSGATTPYRYITGTTIMAVAPTPLAPKESLAASGERTVVANDTGTTDSWNITNVSFDFGDKTPVVSTSDGIAVSHTYAKGGTYTVTETLTDADGQTATTSSPFTTAALAPGTLIESSLTTTGAWNTGFTTVPSGGAIARTGVTGLPDGSAQAVGVTTAGALELNIRSAAGVWQGWSVLNQPGGKIVDAGIAGMPNGSSQIIALTSTGQLLHDIRNANGTWQASGWGAPAGSTGIKQAAITAMPNGDSQLVAVTTAGTLEFDIRFANPAGWQGWRTLSQPGVTVTDASVAGMPDGSSQFVEVTSGGVLKHDIRFADGSWQPSGWGAPGWNGSGTIVQASIAAEPNDSTEIVALTSDSGLELDRRIGSPASWTGWSAFDTGTVGSLTESSIGEMHDGSAQVLTVAGG